MFWGAESREEESVLGIAHIWLACPVVAPRRDVLGPSWASQAWDIRPGVMLAIVVRMARVIRLQLRIWMDWGIHVGGTPWPASSTLGGRSPLRPSWRPQEPESIGSAASHAVDCLCVAMALGHRHGRSNIMASQYVGSWRRALLSWEDPWHTVAGDRWEATRNWECGVLATGRRP